MWEALLACNEDRAHSFADIIQRLRASFRRINPDVPHLDALDLLKKMPSELSRLRILETSLRNWLEERPDTASTLAMGAIERLLKEAIDCSSQSPTELALHDRAKHRLGNLL